MYKRRNRIIQETSSFSGQVEPIGLDDRIKSCKYLGFYYSNSHELVGVSALKEKKKSLLFEPE